MSTYVAAVYVGHDASIAIVGEGRIVHFERERFSRTRHDAGDEIKQLYGVALAHLGISDADVVAVVGISGSMGHQGDLGWTDYNDVIHVPTHGDSFCPGRPLYCIPHHTAHLAYAFYTSPYKFSRLVAQDGGGDGFEVPFLRKTHEYTCSVDCAVGVGLHSFGGSGSFHAEWIAARFIGGAWQVACETILHRPYTEGTLMAALAIPREQVEDLTGISVYHYDELHRLQRITTRTFDHLVPCEPTSMPVALAGGCALNGIAMYNLLKREDVSAIHVPPAVHDGGLTVGAAMLVLHKVLGVPRARYDKETVAFCGYTELALEGTPPVARIAEALAAGKVVGVAYGKAESGPRALGHRSLLADPRAQASKDKLNRIKGREPWRPTAPVVLREHGETYFDLINPNCYDYMTTIARARSGAETAIPAALHVDGSARVQVVHRGDVPLGQIVAAFYELTSCPVLLNTSLNGRGEPICNTAADAEQFFHAAPEIDAMAIGDRWLER